MKNRFYTITVDSQLDTRLKIFMEQLNENEEVVSQVVAGNKLVIATKEKKEDKYSRPKNLLLEEHES